MKSITLWVSLSLSTLLIWALWYVPPLFFPRHTLDYSPIFHQRLNAFMHLDIKPTEIPFALENLDRICAFETLFISHHNKEGHLILPYLHNKHTSTAALLLIGNTLNKIDLPLSDYDLKRIIQEGNDKKITALLTIFLRSGRQTQDSACIQAILNRDFNSSHLSIDKYPDLIANPDQYLDTFIKLLRHRSLSANWYAMEAIEKIGVYNRRVGEALLENALYILKNEPIPYLIKNIELLEHCSGLQHHKVNKILSDLLCVIYRHQLRHNRAKRQFGYHNRYGDSSTELSFPTYKEEKNALLVLMALKNIPISVPNQQLMDHIALSIAKYSLHPKSSSH